MTITTDIAELVKISVDKAIECEIEAALKVSMEDLQTEMEDIHARLRYKVSHVAVELDSMVDYTQEKYVIDPCKYKKYCPKNQGG